MSNSALTQIDYKKCDDLHALISRQVIPMDIEPIYTDSFSREYIGNFVLLLVAICHQTSPLNKQPLHGYVNNVYLKGWDYLLAKLKSYCVANKAFLHRDHWLSMKPELLKSIFHDDIFGCTLSGIEARSKLVVNLGQVMREMGVLFIEEVFVLCKSNIGPIDFYSDNNCMLSYLSKFNAYSDPVCKKSYFFLSVMRNSGIWEFNDNENLAAPVDYHEVRGHLRIGTVKITDVRLFDKIVNRINVSPEEDVAIRRAVRDAIQYIASISPLHSPSMLHYLFWNIFRTCCGRNETHCKKCPSECKLPKKYTHLRQYDRTSKSTGCPFSSICASKDLTIKICEHMIDTDYY